MPTRRSPRPKSGKSSRAVPGRERASLDSRLTTLENALLHNQTRLTRTDEALTDHADALHRLNRANLNLGNRLATTEDLAETLRMAVNQMLDTKPLPWYRRLFGKLA